jgi:hypothetical protein
MLEPCLGVYHYTSVPSPRWHYCFKQAACVCRVGTPVTQGSTSDHAYQTSLNIEQTPGITTVPGSSGARLQQHLEPPYSSMCSAVEYGCYFEADL